MKSDGEKNIQTTFELNFNQTIIKIIHPFLWSQTQHHGSNDVNKVHDPKSNPRSARKQSQNNITFNIHKKGF